MSRYLKSYSNYVLKSKHQNTSNGTIYERDITTIGGRDQFAPGQIPIYRSGNFVITTNSDYSAYKKISNKDWHRSEAGEVWTKGVLDGYEKDEVSSYDRKIRIKKDYLDLRDFAYYGSCSELIRASINDIVKTFPGELYVPTQKVWIDTRNGTVYTDEDAAKKAASSAGAILSERIIGLSKVYSAFKGNVESLADGMPNTFNYELPQWADDYGRPLALVDNPFWINIHDKFIPEGADALKYFAEGGYEKYVSYKKENGEWDFDNPYKISSVNVVYEANNKKKKADCPGDYIGYVRLGFSHIENKFSVVPEKPCEDCGECDEGDYSVYFSGDSYTNGQQEKINVTDETYDEESDGMKIYMFVGENGEVLYFVDATNIDKDSYRVNPSYWRVRPNNKVIDDFFDNLDLFEQVLLNRDSSPLYTASFEIIRENERGLYTHTEQFTFPTTYGGYNIGSGGIVFSNYINSLVKIGEFYDEHFSDNLWRSMTHEAIKNFDWTYTREYSKDEEIPFVEGGLKIQKIIRIYGREFDEVKNYIDAIKDVNTITYDNINNLPDYFFSDKLEIDGWDIKPIHPLVLSEFVNDYDSVPLDLLKVYFNGDNDKKAEAEKNNSFSYNGVDYKIRRVFNQNFGSETYKPYTIENITEDSIVYTDSQYGQYVSSYEVDNESGKSDCDLSFDININGGNGEYLRDGYHGACGNLIKLYTNEKEWTSNDANTEFMKRLILNSKYIWRNKGTVNGVEMLLSLFGLRSKHSVFANTNHFKFNMNNGKVDKTKIGEEYYKKYADDMTLTYDYDIKEYTLFTVHENDTYISNKQMYEVDWINSTKLISYDTDDYKQGIYNSYQGLPVMYKDFKKADNVIERRLYPYFDKKVEYDGEIYYQMRGGWLSKYPFMFDDKNNIVVEDNGSNRTNKTLYTETIKNVKAVQTLEELLAGGNLANNSGDICQVLDISGRYAIIDGKVYPLLREYDGASETSENGLSFFYVTVENNTLEIGNMVFTDFVIISNPYFDNWKQKIDLTDSYYDGMQLKVYLKEKKDDEGKITYDIDAYSNDASISTFTVFENGKYLEGDNYTNYFRINDVDFFNELSVFGWQQLREDEYEYYRLNTAIDYREGNNPHTGHMQYDNGHEYFTYFNKVFKYSYDNDLIDYRQYTDSEDYYDTFEGFGFKNLIDPDECNHDYTKYLVEDDKCHYFGDIIANRINSTGEKVIETFKYVDDAVTTSTEYNFKNADGRLALTSKVIVNVNGKYVNWDTIKYGDILTATSENLQDKIDGITNQVVNTKRMDIDFYLKSEVEYSNEWIEEIKYLDSVVMPYLTQMIPSTVICKINYVTNNSSNG